MSYRKTDFDDFNATFTDNASDFLNNDSPTIENLEDVLDAYNAIISYSELNYENKKRATKEYITENITANRATLQRCYEKLQIPVTLPGKLLSTIHYVPQPKPNTSNENSNKNNSHKSDENLHKNPNKSPTTHSNPNNQSHTSNLNQTIPTKMAQTRESFLKIASNVLNYKYGGDPLKLNSFILDVELVNSLASNDDTRAFCLTFLKSRLEGKAEECIPDQCESVQALITALKDKIKPDNSGIIEGKMTALQLRKGDYSKFSAEAEKLAEALRRTLIVEGLTKAKAEEMTIQKTIEICRATTKSDVVKAVLENGNYKSPADVIAKFITQSDKVRREFKEAKNAQKNANNNGHGNGNGNGNARQNKPSNKNRNWNNSQGNQSSNNRGNYRGNGRGRQQQNQQQNRDRNNGNNRSSRNEHTIRLVTGASTAQPAEPTSSQQEQFFRIEN